MADVSDLSEAEVVALREQTQQAKFSSERTKSIVLAVFFGLACMALFVFGFWTFSLCALFVSLIGVSNYFAANGHLHHLQRRAKHRKKLARDFSKLKPDVRGSRDPNPSGVPTPTG